MYSAILQRRLEAFGIPLLVSISLLSCGPEAAPGGTGADSSSPIEAKLAQYETVRLTTDIDVLTEAERQMIPLLIEAADAMTEIFWQESYGDREAFMSSLDDPAMRRYGEINYGPWDRLNGDKPFAVVLLP